MLSENILTSNHANGICFRVKMFQDKCNRDLIVITFNVIIIVIDCIVILFIRNRNQARSQKF